MGLGGVRYALSQNIQQSPPATAHDRAPLRLTAIAWPRPALGSVLLCRLPQPGPALQVRSLSLTGIRPVPPTKHSTSLGSAPARFWVPRSRDGGRRRKQ